MEAEYKVRTAVFEGPLELLYELIEKRKLAVSDISLAQVTDDFIAYLKQLGTVPLSYTANFIMTAAALILIKSKSLLPALSLSDEEEQSIDELKRRLALYKLYRSVTDGVRSVFGAAPLFKRPYPKVTPLFVPDPKLTLDAIGEGMHSALASVPKKEKIEEVTLRKVMTIEEMIDTLTERVKEVVKFSFRDFSKHKGGASREERVYVIVSFLAILELVKQGIVDVRQDSKFEDIEVARLEAQPA